MNPVPYVNQLDNMPNNDCGPACALMLLHWNGKALDANLAEWAKSIRPTSEGEKPAKRSKKKGRAKTRSLDPKDKGTDSQDLGKMLTSLGLTPTFANNAQYPYIELVRYLGLPAQNRLVPDADIWHWIVRMSDTTYHDPYPKE